MIAKKVAANWAAFKEFNSEQMDNLSRTKVPAGFLWAVHDEEFMRTSRLYTTSRHVALQDAHLGCSTTEDPFVAFSDIKFGWVAVWFFHRLPDSHQRKLQLYKVELAGGEEKRAVGKISNPFGPNKDTNIWEIRLCQKEYMAGFHLWAERTRGEEVYSVPVVMQFYRPKMSERGVPMEPLALHLFRLAQARGS